MSKTPTLEGIQAEHKKLGDMIAKLMAQAKTEFHFPEAQIELSHGEQYAGIILGKDGEASYHLVLLTGQKEDINWQAAIDWAESLDGTLPTRREQSLLFANLKEEFSNNCYWSCEQHAGSAAYAWYQGFEHGSQGYSTKGNERRARAVRRLVI
jgi:hypothetical protein